MKYYAVRKGKKTGVFTSEKEFKESIGDFDNPEYRIFKTEKDAEDYIARYLRRIDGDNNLYRDMEYEDADLPENEEYIRKYVVTKDVTFETYDGYFDDDDNNVGNSDIKEDNKKDDTKPDTQVDAMKDVTNNNTDTKEPNTTSQQSDSQQMSAQPTDSRQTAVQLSDSQSTSVEQPDKQTDNLTTFKIQNKKIYKKSKKITIKDLDGIKSVSLNGKKIKSGKKKISFKLSKYKKYLKKKTAWNKLVVVDANGNVAKIKFRVK